MGEATEKLRAMLDELGVKWWEGWAKGLTCFDGAFGVRYMADCTLGKMFVRTLLPVTPEQAIAATLGSGKLTAEQVMTVAGKHQPDYCSDTHVCFDWQAIADELNATLGSGTCYMSFVDEYETASGEEEYLCECSECGSQTWEPAHDLPLYCRKCGRKVVRE